MLGLVASEPDLAGVIAEHREFLVRLRAVVEVKDAEIAMLRQELDAERELRRRVELRVAELERRLRMDSYRLGDSQLEGADRGEGGAPGTAAGVGAGAQEGPPPGRAARAPRERPGAGPGPGRPQGG